MAGVIRGTSTGKLYQELGLESLQNRRKLQRLCLFYKIYKYPLNLHNLIPTNFQSSYSCESDPFIKDEAWIF